MSVRRWNGAGYLERVPVPSRSSAARFRGSSKMLLPGARGLSSPARQLGKLWSLIGGCKLAELLITINC